MDSNLCSEWYRNHGGPQGLINRVVQDSAVTDEVKDCLSFYFNGLFNRRLTQYLREDLKYDKVPYEHLEFLQTLGTEASMILVSYRYQTQFEFLRSLEELKLSQKGLFGPHNAFAVGEPGTSSDGSKARFVGSMWRREIRAQRRLTSEIGKTFPLSPLGIRSGISISPLTSAGFFLEWGRPARTRQIRCSGRSNARIKICMPVPECSGPWQMNICKNACWRNVKPIKKQSVQ